MLVLFDDSQAVTNTETKNNSVSLEDKKKKLSGLKRF
jgi:hypothetical protein